MRRRPPRPSRLRQSSILPWHPLRRSRTSPSHPRSLAKCRVLCGRRLLLLLRQSGRVSTYRFRRGLSMFPAAPLGSPATVLLRRRWAQVRSNGGTSNCLRRSSLLRLRPKRTTTLCLLRSMQLNRLCPPRRRTIRQHSTWITSKIPAKARPCSYRDLRHLVLQVQVSVVHRRWCLPLHRRHRFQRRPCHREDRLYRQ